MSVATPLQLAQSAVHVVSQGAPPLPEALDQARTDIAGALAQAPDDLQILFHAFQFQFRSGNLDEAEALCRRRLALAAIDHPHHARAYTNLGLIAHTRGNFDEAEPLLTRALELDRRHNPDPHAIARDLGNLALVPESKGDLDRAEALFREGLALACSIQPPTPLAEEIIAGKLANLGDIALRRGKPQEARDLWTQAVAIFDRLGVTKWQPDFTKKFADLDKR